MSATVPAIMSAAVRENDDAVLSEQDWEREAGEMVEEVIRTQKEVAELLSSHNGATSELQALKESCEQELEDLQEDAWRLSLYAELERMRSQLELLAPLTADSCDCAGCDEVGSSKDKQAAACADSVVKAANTSPRGAFHDGERELQQLDQEIAAINQELAQAKKEMASMMQLKADLEREMGGVHQQLAAGGGDVHSTLAEEVACL